MFPRPALAALLLAALGEITLGSPARADACDGLTARLIRATGASLAGRDGPLVVFRAEDAERMSLSCGPEPVVLVRAARRVPAGDYFTLIGLAGQTLAGGSAGTIATLARGLHQEALLTGLPQQAATGRLTLRCEPTDRADGFHGGALCRIARTGKTGGKAQDKTRRGGVSGLARTD